MHLAVGSAVDVPHLWVIATTDVDANAGGGMGRHVAGVERHVDPRADLPKLVVSIELWMPDRVNWITRLL